MPDRISTGKERCGMIVSDIAVGNLEMFAGRLLASQPPPLCRHTIHNYDCDVNLSKVGPHHWASSANRQGQARVCWIVFHFFRASLSILSEREQK